MSNHMNRREFSRYLSAAAAASVAAPMLCTPLLCKSAETIISKKTFTYKTVGKLELKADVYRADDNVRRPVVFWIHGGALIVGSRRSIDGRVKKTFLDAGYAIVSIDYRLAPETKLPAIIEDVEDAYSWLHGRGPQLFQVDTRKIAVMGSSAGGYLTLTSGFRAKPKPAVLVAFWGYGNLVGDWLSRPNEFYRKQPAVSKKDAFAGVGGPELTNGSRDGKRRGAFYLYCRQNGLWPKLVSGFNPRTEVDKIAPYMPVRNVTRLYPPTLMIHGTTDTDVPYEQSTMMETQFKKFGVEHKLMTVKDAGHGLGGGKKKLIEQAYAEVLPFVEKHMK